MEKLMRIWESGGIKKDFALIVVSAMALAANLAGVSLPFDAAWIAIALCGLPIIAGAVYGLVTRFDVKADVLVSLALIASVITGELFAAGEVAVIMQLGSLLEELTVARARDGLEKLVRLTPRTARVVVDGAEKILSADEVKVGDVLRVRPGETIPVDGVIISGETSINQASLTGESLPVDKKSGDEVASGTLNQFGAFEMWATRVGEDSSLQRLIRLTRSADAGKAKIVRLADRWATWVVITALTVAAVCYAVTGDITRSVTVLVVFCPCALVLATPTAIMAAIGNVTRRGILVREGDALERLASVTSLALDKTGTLTVGQPQVMEVVSAAPEITERSLFELVAAAERSSEHPLGRAVVRSYGEKYNEPLPMASHFAMRLGKGVYARVNGIDIAAGTEELLREYGAEPDKEAAKSFMERGCTVIYVALNGKFAGFIALSDTLRASARTMIDGVRGAGVEPVLLTGDNARAAACAAAQLGVTRMRAGCLPEDKLEFITRAQQRKENVCMLGDGINDAPALKRASVGIAMGGIGSDIAIEAADIAIIGESLKELPHLFLLSRRMMRTIKWNLTFSMLLNFVAIILALTAVLSPVTGALVHNAGSIFVIGNSALLLNWSEE